jgi:hypothetical protein
LRFANVDEKDFPLMIDGPSSRAGGNTALAVPVTPPVAPARQAVPVSPAPASPSPQTLPPAN